MLNRCLNTESRSKIGMSTKITDRQLWESLLTKPPVYYDFRWQLYWTHAYWRTRGCLPGTSSAACPHRRSCSWHWAAAGVLQWPAGYWSPQQQLELVTGLGCQQPGSPGHRGHMTALSLSAVTSWQPQSEILIGISTTISHPVNSTL